MQELIEIVLEPLRCAFAPARLESSGFYRAVSAPVELKKIEPAAPELARSSESRPLGLAPPYSGLITDRLKSRPGGLLLGPRSLSAGVELNKLEDNTELPIKPARSGGRGAAVAGVRRSVTLGTFISRRLGSDTSRRLGRMFSRSFAAGSFAGFWYYWNPVLTYYLALFFYRPLRRVLPRPLAVVATFAFSGFFLHDVPFWWAVTALKTRSLPVPFVCIWFVAMAILILVAERLRLDFSARPLAVRVALNALNIAVGALPAYAVCILAR